MERVHKHNVARPSYLPSHLLIHKILAVGSTNPFLFRLNCRIEPDKNEILTL